jgi:tRNA_anti-like
MTRANTGRRWRAGVAGIALAGVAAACVDSLPAEDLRITTATPVAKLSVGLLWKDFQDDARAAHGRYWSKAVAVTGAPTLVSTPDATDPVIVFAVDGDHGVRAYLLHDEAPALLGAAKVGERLTLKCFCDDLHDGDLVLRSCIPVGASTSPLSFSNPSSSTPGRFHSRLASHAPLSRRPPVASRSPWPLAFPTFTMNSPDPTPRYY